MDFGEDFLRFVAPGADRLVALAGILAARGLDYRVLRTGQARHLALRLGYEEPRLILMAHYDRVDGSPGVLDNSSACLQLADFARRRSAEGKAKEPPVLVLFSDKEEAPADGGASDQGSYALARAISSGGTAGAMPPVLVLDVTGRGDRLLLSSTPADLLVRGGRGGSPAAEAHAALAGLARRAARRAGLAEPLEAALPWSDDLGLVLGGMGALALSLLPEGEAAALLDGRQPATWDCLHGPGDDLGMAEGGAFGLMAAFLDAVAHELGPGDFRLPENRKSLV